MKRLLLFYSCILLLTACTSATDDVDISRVDFKKHDLFYMLDTPSDFEPIYAQFNWQNGEGYAETEDVLLRIHFPQADADRINEVQIWYVANGKAYAYNATTKKSSNLSKSATTDLKKLLDCEQCQHAP